MNQLNLIIDALEQADRMRRKQGYTEEYLQAALAAAHELKAELAKPEPVVSFTDNEEGLCIQLECDGSYYWQNLSDCDAAKFFVDAYRGKNT